MSVVDEKSQKKSSGPLRQQAKICVVLGRQARDAGFESARVEF